MNTKLVESLVQVIEALPSEDYLLLQGQLTDRNIQKTEGVCGRYARIRNTRIPVWTIVSLHNQGADEAELLRNFPSLTLFYLAATRAYYATHQAEIDSPKEQLSRHKCRLRDERNCSRTLTSDYARYVF